VRLKLLYVSLGALALIVLPFALSDFRTGQLATVGAYFIAILGLDVLTGHSGQISLGHGAFMAIGAYTTAILVGHHGVRDLATIPIAAAVAGGIGLLAGVPALRLSGLYLALATFGIAVVFPTILKKFDTFTGGSTGISFFGSPHQTGHGTGVTILGAHLSNLQWLYALTWVIGEALFLLVWFLLASRFGRALRAVRDSEIASTANGVSTAGIKTAAFGISAFFCGIAGALYAVGITYVNPDTFPIELSILLLVGVVIGGAGSTWGMIFGAFFVEFIRISWGPALLDQVDRVHNIDTHAAGSGLVVYGVILLAVLYVAPAGMAGLVRRLFTGRAAVAAWAKPGRTTPSDPATGAEGP